MPPLRSLIWRQRLECSFSHCIDESTHGTTAAVIQCHSCIAAAAIAAVAALLPTHPTPQVFLEAITRRILGRWHLAPTESSSLGQLTPTLATTHPAALSALHGQHATQLVHVKVSPLRGRAPAVRQTAIRYSPPFMLPKLTSPTSSP